MKVWRHTGLAIALLTTQGVAMAQNQQQSPPAPPRVSPIKPLSEIAVPYDPEEPVSSGARQTQTPEERAAAVEIFAKAHRLSNVRLYPYRLKTTFTTYGSGTDGTWSLEDMSPGEGIYRWTAQGPSFSGVFLSRDKLLSSNLPNAEIPLRLAQVRDAMWGSYPVFGPHAALLLADGNVAGAGARCVLIVREAIRKDEEFASGRSMNEEEFCVDANSGLLVSYSPVPGYFIRYDYASALHFHDKVTLPNGFTIFENGKAAVEARIESVGEPATPNDSVYSSAGLTPTGTGQVIEGAVRSQGLVPNVGSDGATQVVILAAMISAEGRVDETDVLSSTDENLVDAARNYISRSGIGMFKAQAQQQPGTTPRAQEVFYMIEFFPRPAQPCPPVTFTFGACGAQSPSPRSQ